MIKFYFVDVSSIQSNVPRSNFSEDQIEQLADIILESEGVLNVILLTQTGMNSYKVLAGDLEYYAAVRAKEKNPRQGEMINAVIVQPSNQDTLLKQADFFKNRSFPVQQEGVKVIDETSLESRLEKQMREFRELQIRENKEIKHELQELKNALNNLTDNINKPITQFVEKPIFTPPSSKPEKSKYDAMTVAQLKEIAKQRNIKVKSKIKKSELIAILPQD
ncbi:ParB N-terminal domain-containing protein [Planktothrix paucivesiculata]|uniref:ParB-like N-terminal domain-containing protein n=1 Tax=Planktothrix paucivesiculata PCC 9631 TaxID=671071 RepID=A0A7Z9BQS1_9CYAN|nr:hypothetical protein [Planktothrix paucivesiculata]VXD15340.1 hypothetical protein PL9631_120072 [Planktothrix paucivesiculata PCC 9631]